MKNDVIYGTDENDESNGGNGKDKLCGGLGRDTLNGGNGKDELFGGTGNDTLNGGNGNDKLLGGTGDDVLKGEKGSDVLFASFGVDYLEGGKDADLFVFGYYECDDPNQDYQGFQIAIVTDFSSSEHDRLVFHTSLAGEISASIANGGTDVLLNIDQDGNGAVDGQVLVQNLVTDLGIDESLSGDALLDFLIFGDGEQEGVLVFEDKCIDQYCDFA